MYDRIQVEVRDINETFKAFKIKNKNQYAKLSNEEEALTRELQLIDEKFEAIVNDEKQLDRSQITTKNTSRQSVSSSATKRRTASVYSGRTNQSISSKASTKPSKRSGVPLPPSKNDMSDKMIQIKQNIEVVQDKISQIGGFNCGWTPSDHEDFLRVKAQHKHKVETLSFLNAILGLIPDSTLDKVKEHISVHKQYMDL